MPACSRSAQAAAASTAASSPSALLVLAQRLLLLPNRARQRRILTPPAAVVRLLRPAVRPVHVRRLERALAVAGPPRLPALAGSPLGVARVLPGLAALLLDELPRHAPSPWGCLGQPETGPAGRGFRAPRLIVRSSHFLYYLP